MVSTRDTGFLMISLQSYGKGSDLVFSVISKERWKEFSE